ncbi:hypothetical protein KC717_00690 [Candidatus Dojkabacteria bacterium]|uniref:DUF5667 domain-containing protein n=1 Tax=Candidatus Dojkabacteria bacterium TaxID=2099670 RepID=A0A955L717_9BACT|nr:hypothetical protein [Candidatus Dojkabacteria bacterium]
MSNTLKFVLSGAGLVLILGLIIGANADPRNPLYIFDRGLESIQGVIRVTPAQQAEFQLDLARERLDELQHVNSNSTRVERILNDYDQNLEQTREIVSDVLDSGDYNADLWASLIQRFIEVDIETLRRKIEVQADTAKANDYEDIGLRVRQSRTRTNQLVDDLFELGVTSIDSNDEFNSFARNRLRGMVNIINTYLDYGVEDVSLITPQATEEEKQRMNEIINAAQEEYFYVRDNIGSDSNKDIYESIVRADTLLNEDLTNILVDISERNTLSDEEIEQLIEE